ncbi:Hpt domain-containing protein [Ktedonobacteria bacterium brp13]|nr:Hpt domain-containing protein [Ktedonobacteria bacterium brp13]
MSNTFDKLSVLDSFIEEVNSYLPEIETNLERLAQSPGDMDALEETYRRTHTIGGSASMMDFPGLAHVAHGMEDILGDARDSLISLNEPCLGLLRRSLGRLHQLLEGIRTGIDEEAVIAEDDADYARYRAQIESPAPASSGVADTPMESNGFSMPASPASFSSPPASSVPTMPSLSPIPPVPSSIPSFDEVLASFRTQSSSPGEDIGWPEEPELVTRFDTTTSMSQIPPTPPIQSTPAQIASVQPSQPLESGPASVSLPQISPSALDALVASTRHSAASLNRDGSVTQDPEGQSQSGRQSFMPMQQEGLDATEKSGQPVSRGIEAALPPILPSAQQPLHTPSVFTSPSSSYEEASNNEFMRPGPMFGSVELPDAGFLSSEPAVVPSAALVPAEARQERGVDQGETTQEVVLPAAYEDMQRETGNLETQAATLKTVVSQLRDAMVVIEGQRSEFKGFLNGSKDALDRMEVWAGKAMGLNLRNSPEQVRRYLPLSVMWVSNTKLKKVLDLLHKITGGVELTDEQFNESLRQLHASIQSCGEAFEQLSAEHSPQFDTKDGWSPWQANVNHDADHFSERVTFERQGDPTALRREIESQVREELRQEYETQRTVEPVNLEAETLKSIEDRLRSEIEIKVRQEFLNQIMSAGDDASSLANRLAPDSRATEKGNGSQPAIDNVVTNVMHPPTGFLPVSSPGPTSSVFSPATGTTQQMNDINEEAAEIFRLEAEEHLQTISMHVAALEKDPTNRDLIQGVRRATHTLKGAAGMMGFSAIADLCHVSEDLLDLVMEGTMAISSFAVSLILDTAEALESLIVGNVTPEVDMKVRAVHKRYAELLGERSPVAQLMEHVDEDLDEIDHLVQPANQMADNQSGDASIRAARNDLSVRVRLQKMDELVNLFGEMLVNRSVLEERLSRLTRLVSDVVVSSNRLGDVGQKLESRFEAATLPSGRSVQTMPGEGDHSLVVRGNAFPPLSGVSGVSGTQHASNPLLQSGQGGTNPVPAHLSEFDELELDRYTEFHQLARGLSEGISDMATLSTEMDTIIRECEGVFSRENRLNTTFQDRLMKVRLVPLSTMVPRLYRAARAVALKQGKDVEFVMEGETTEVDRTVYEEIAGPLLHLVRNAVNHATETPAVRVSRGKTPTGQIKLSAAYEGNQIMITVRDDGNGIDRERVRQTAIMRGLIRADQHLSEDEVVSLIFRPGFSTAGVVSEESGRGVGLDVVRDSVSRLRGTLVVESAPGLGTAFTMTFPTSLAIQSTMMVKVAGQQFALPTVYVESIGRLDGFKRANSGGQPAVLVRNDLYPLQMLSQYLALPMPAAVEEKAQLLLVNAGGHRVALVVDEINGKSDIVMKSLGPHLREVHGIAGGTVLGNGRVVLVLDLNSLLASNSMVSNALFGRRDVVPASPPAFQGTAGPVKPQRVDVSAPSNRSLPQQPKTSTGVGGERGKHILVVDDSPSVRRVVSTMLKQNGWAVQMARDGVEALEMISNETPAAVLLDVEMPRMDGYELISTVRAQEQYRTLPLIVLTSRAASKHQQRAMSLGASSYVVKPYQDEELLNTINSLVYGAATR